MPEAPKTLQQYYPTKGKMGGLVYGPLHQSGGVLAELEGGEYVMNRSTVNRFGAEKLSMMNSGFFSSNDREVKALLREAILAIRQQKTEVKVYTDLEGQMEAKLSEYDVDQQERAYRQA